METKRPRSRSELKLDDRKRQKKVVLQQNKQSWMRRILRPVSLFSATAVLAVTGFVGSRVYENISGTQALNEAKTTFSQTTLIGSRLSKIDRLILNNPSIEEEMVKMVTEVAVKDFCIEFNCDPNEKLSKIGFLSDKDFEEQKIREKSGCLASEEQVRLAAMVSAADTDPFTRFIRFRLTGATRRLPDNNLVDNPSSQVYRNTYHELYHAEAKPKVYQGLIVLSSDKGKLSETFASGFGLIAKNGKVNKYGISCWEGFTPDVEEAITHTRIEMEMRKKGIARTKIGSQEYDRWVSPIETYIIQNIYEGRVDIIDYLHSNSDLDTFLFNIGKKTGSSDKQAVKNGWGYLDSIMSGSRR